jgi:hypothetical protein
MFVTFSHFHPYYLQKLSKTVSVLYSQQTSLNGINYIIKIVKIDDSNSP